MRVSVRSLKNSPVWLCRQICLMSSFTESSVKFSRQKIEDFHPASGTIGWHIFYVLKTIVYLSAPRPTHICKGWVWFRGIIRLANPLKAGFEPVFQVEFSSLTTHYIWQIFQVLNHQLFCFPQTNGTSSLLYYICMLYMLVPGTSGLVR